MMSREDIRYYLDWLVHSPESPWFDYRIELAAYLGYGTNSQRHVFYKFINHDGMTLSNEERVRHLLPEVLEGRVIPAINGAYVFPTKPRALSVDRRPACA